MAPPDSSRRRPPSHTLRRRFDDYLTLVGEVPLDSLRALVAQQAATELREPALSAVMALWDRYVALQQTRWKNAVDLSRRPPSIANPERQTHPPPVQRAKHADLCWPPSSPAPT